MNDDDPFRKHRRGIDYEELFYSRYEDPYYDPYPVSQTDSYKYSPPKTPAPREDILFQNERDDSMWAKKIDGLFPDQPIYYKEVSKAKSMSRAEDILKEALNAAKAKIQQQDELLHQLLDAPTTIGYVLSIRGKSVLVSTPDAIVEAKFPLQPVDGKDLSLLIQNGSLVRLQTDPAIAITDVLEHHDLGGDLLIATKPGKDEECEVDFQGTARRIRYARNVKVPEVGDRLMVDTKCHIAIKNLGPDESKFSFQGVTGVSWDDVGGLHQAKLDLQEAVELPFKHAELYKKYGKSIVKGALLYGPPGCGKTMLAKATATAVSKIHSRKQTDTGFIYVKGPEMLDKYIGNTEAQVRSLFARAKKHFKKNGYPAIIFIDEADALLGKRGGRPNMGIEATVVPQFLAEMDGLDESGAIVLLATNRPDSLDSAVTRDGRIDLKIRVTRPDQKGTEEIFKLYLKDKPIANVSVDDMAEFAAGYLFSDKYEMYKLIGTKPSDVRSFSLSHMVNGAMIAGMVDKATTLALRRDVTYPGDSVGLTLDDLRLAADSIFTQNQHLNHEEEVKEFVEMNHLQVSDIVKAQYGISV